MRRQSAIPAKPRRRSADITPSAVSRTATPTRLHVTFPRAIHTAWHARAVARGSRAAPHTGRPSVRARTLRRRRHPAGGRAPDDERAELLRRYGD
ncbi:hypothetical protein [Streptomyces flavalbus]|uniref:Uncharacterized protein n=1 Tax=Streptomyces flavalbus TaxID=2665155 RepID=A0ABW2W3M2_9ACTN